MELNETIQNNKLIAEFEGATKCTIENEVYDDPSNRYCEGYESDNDKGFKLPVHQLEYHNSWDWLMPVIKRVLNDLQDIKDKNQGDSAVYGECIETEGWIIGALLDTEIEGVYKGTLQAIRIINNNRLNTQQ